MGDLPPEPQAPQPQPPEEEETPRYMRPWFVATVFVGCAALAGVIYLLGNTGNVVLDSEGEAVPAFESGSAEALDAPEPGRRQDCPDPGEPVEPEAAELVQLFGATATGGGFGSLPAATEVQDQLEATFPAPPVNRMTRIRGWTGSTGSWSSCVLSSWVGPDGPMQSIDIVTASVVPGSERSDADPDDADPDDADPDDADPDDADPDDADPDDADPDEADPDDADPDDADPDDEDRRSSSSARSELEDRWEITTWLRGVPEPPPPSRAVTIEFYNSKRACRRPDRPASVTVPDEGASDRLLYTIEELASGTPGRANSAATRIPADVQVLEATVSDGRARVVLTPTLTELSGCEGTAAFEQVRDTAADLAVETIPPGDDSDPEVEVVIEGEAVGSLRR